MKTVLKLVSTILILVTLAGCASVGAKMDMTRMDQIEEGVTTRQQLVQWFGKPSAVGLAGSQKTAVWIYSEARNRPQNFIPIVGALAGGMDTKLQQLMVAFDQDDIVATFTFTDSASQIQTGIIR